MISIGLSVTRRKLVASLTVCLLATLLLFALVVWQSSEQAPDPERLPFLRLPESEPLVSIPTERAAAAFAAELANNKCHSFWDTRPFRASQYSAKRVRGRWTWGKYDPAGPGGYSAEVSFGLKGENPIVRVHWSTDQEFDWDAFDRGIDEDLDSGTDEDLDSADDDAQE